MNLRNLISIILYLASTGAVFAQESKITSKEMAEKVAAKALAEKCKSPVVCEFSTHRIENGWFVMAVFRYTLKDGSYGYRVGGNGHRGIYVYDDGTIKEVPGA